jgi:hypothetical protein
MTSTPTLFVRAFVFCFVAINAFALGPQLAQAGEAASAPPVYTPGLGEIMSLQQMRHSKLWSAGEAENWPLAAYELDELKEGFEDASTFDAEHEGQPIAGLIKSITPAPLTQLEAAIKAKSPARFAAAFDQLTAACNNCHQSADKGFIHIQRPTTSPYTNQDFSPQK